MPKRRLAKMPTVKIYKSANSDAKFPVDAYSYSTFDKFSSNPFMFKVNILNGEQIDTVTNVSSVLGSGLHKALETYFGGNPDVAVMDEADAMKEGHRVGLEYLNNYSDGFIQYNKTTVPSREKLNEKYASAYFGYLKEHNAKDIAEILLVEKKITHQIEIDGKVMPVPLRGKMDLVYRNKKGQIIIRDHKFTSKYSDADKIDGSKLIQAAFYYCLIYAEFGEAPYSIVFEEYKVTGNADGSKQLREYEIVYKDATLIFEFFHRLYADITDAILGKQVFVPNVRAMFDNEVSILAYIHRLDETEERAKKFKEEKVDNLTDFLKKKIQTTGSMKKYLEVVNSKFISANSLNYKDMQIEEKIKMKLAEHGLGVEFDSKLVGSSVTLYRYEPSVGLKMKRLEQYVKDIELVTETSNIRILAPIPDSGLVGFEVPNKQRSFPDVVPKNNGFEIAIGQTITGEVEYCKITDAPHILAAGASGSGKSTWLNATIPQLATLGDLHLFDPKLVELSQFESIASEYESDVDRINTSLHNLVLEMEERYKKMSAMKIRNISETKEFKYKFVIIDEFGDLAVQNPEGYTYWTLCDKHEKYNQRNGGELIQLLSTKRKLRVAQQEVVDSVLYCENCEKHVVKPFEESLLRLASKGRAAGIHLIIATQSPRADIINGKIKANFPTKIVFRTAKAIDSMVVIDQNGAEKLLGKGDMLYSGPDGALKRLQGYFV